MTYNTVKSGRWRYGDDDAYLWIVRQDYDYYYEEGYDDEPHLNESGYAYYVLYGLFDDIGKAQSRSKTCLSEESAVRLAEKTSMGVVWTDEIA